MKTLVSVVMPAYNSAATIIPAIESVFYQDVALELIIVDDCSSDNTYDLLKDRIEKDGIIYYKNSVNRGVAYSRNYGIERANGKYIAFLDSDDIWRKGKLKAQIELIENSKALLCATARELMTNEGDLTGRIIPVPDSVDYKKLLCGNVINCSSVLILSDLMKEYPMTDDDLHEDYITWLKILKGGGKAIFLKEPYLLYRLSKFGKSSDKFKSAKATFGVYRRLGLSLPVSVYYFFRYAVSALIKYSR